MSWQSTWFWVPLVLIWTSTLIMPSTRRAYINGWICLRRHPLLWKAPAAFAFAAGLFETTWVATFHWRTHADFPLYLPPPDEFPPLAEAVFGSLLGAAEILAADINCLVAPFPLSVICAVLILVNYRGLTRELGVTLHRRFGPWSILLGCLLLLCLFAELVKPILFFIGPATAETITYRDFLMGSTVINAMAFAFEYLLGTCLQLYLLLLAYSWVRGLQFNPEKVLPFAVRRLGFVMQWALVIIIATIVTMFLPLLLETWAAPEPGGWKVTETIHYLARIILAVGMLWLSTVQIHLALHNNTLRGALAGHAEFLRRNGIPCFLFLLAAFVSFLALKTVESIGESYLGKSLAGESWKTFLQTGAAAFGGWILAAWVCFYTSLQKGSRHISF